MNGAPLSPEDRRAVLVAALTAGLSALATGLVNWALEAAKARTRPPADDRKGEPADLAPPWSHP